eukprot:scaffold325_cov343-Pavlova_lutheri.AAC.16
MLIFSVKVPNLTNVSEETLSFDHRLHLYPGTQTPRTGGGTFSNSLPSSGEDPLGEFILCQRMASVLHGGTTFPKGTVSTALRLNCIRATSDA